MAKKNVSIRLGIEDAEIVKRALSELGTEGDRALNRIDRATKPTSASLKGLNTAVKQGEQQLRSYARQAGPVGAVLESMGKGGLVAAGAVGALSVGFIKLTHALISASRESFAFEESLSEVSTLLSDTDSEMPAITASAKALASEFGRMPIDQVKAFYQVISAGAADAAEATDILRAANKLAIGGVTDLTTAADGLTTILNAYGLGADQAGAVSDQLFAAMRAGKTTVGELSQSISFVASIAAQANVPLNEVLSATAALTKGGIPTQRAMRGLAQVMASVIKPSSEAAKMSKQLGIDFSAAALESEGLAGFLNKVREATQGSSEQMAQLFGGVESLVPVLALTGQQAGDFAEILDASARAAGTSDEAFGRMARNRIEGIRQLSTEWNKIQIAIGDTILDDGGARALAEALQEVRKALEDLGSFASQFDLVSLASPFGGGGATAARRIYDRASGEPDVAASGRTGTERMQTLIDLVAQSGGRPTSSASSGGTSDRVIGRRAPATIPAQNKPQEQDILGSFSIGGIADLEAQVLGDAIKEMAGQATAELQSLMEALPSGFEGVRAGELALAEARDKTRLATLSGNEAALERLRQTQLRARIEAEIAGASPDQLQALKAVQDQEVTLVRIRQEQADRSREAAAEEAAVAMEEARRIDSLRNASATLAQLNPQLGVMASALTDLVMGGDVGAAAMSGLGLAVNHFAAEAQKAAADLEKAKKALESAARQAGPVASSLVKSLDPAAYEASLGRVNSQINDWFEGLRSQGHGIAGAVQLMLNQINLLESAGKDLTGRQARDLGIFGLGGADPQRLKDDLANLGLSLSDAVSDVLTVKDAFDEVSSSAKGAASNTQALEQAIRAESDLRRIALRQDAVTAFQQAGADPNKRADVFADLQRRIAEELSAVEADVRRAGSRTDESPAAKPAGSTDTGSGDGPGPASTESIDLSDLPAETVSWMKAVNLIRATAADFGVSHWGGIVDMSAMRGNKDGVQYEIPWSEALDLSRSTVAGFGVGHWGGIVDMAALRGNAEGVQYKIPWHEALDLTAGTAEQFGAKEWSSIVRLTRTGDSTGHGEAGQTGLEKHKRPWSDAIEFHAFMAESIGVTTWSQIVKLSRGDTSGDPGLTTGLEKHNRPWSDAIKFFSQEAKYFEGGNSNWSSLVRLPDTMSKHSVAPSRFMSIDYSQPLEVRAQDLVRVIGNIDLSKYITVGNIRPIVEEVVREGQRRGSIPQSSLENPPGF